MGLHPKAWDIYWLYTKPNRLKIFRRKSQFLIYKLKFNIRFEMYWPNDTKSWNLSTFHETEIFEKIGVNYLHCVESFD